MINKNKIASIFDYLKSDATKFFEHVSDDVNWTVMGTHPLAGVYHDKSTFIESTFARLGKLMNGSLSLVIDHVYTDNDSAIIEMHAQAELLNGKPFDNHYCWVVRFNGDLIVEVRAYLDSALVAESIMENEKA